MSKAIIVEPLTTLTYPCCGKAQGVQCLGDDVGCSAMLCPHCLAKHCSYCHLVFKRKPGAPKELQRCDRGMDGN